MTASRVTAIRIPAGRTTRCRVTAIRIAAGRDRMTASRDRDPHRRWPHRRCRVTAIRIAAGRVTAIHIAAAATA